MILRQSARGNFKWTVIDAERNVVKSGSGHNAILNQGLDYVASYTWAEVFRYCALGTDSTAVSFSQVGLGAEITRTGDLLDIFGAHETVLVGEHLSMSRIFEFPVQGAYTFREVGWSPIATTANNLFSRVVLPFDVSVGATESLLFQYELEISVGPITNQSLSSRFQNIDISGNGRAQLVALSAVGEDGSSTFFGDGAGALEPSVSCQAFISENSDALVGIGESVDRSVDLCLYANSQISSYVTSSYEVTKSFTFRAGRKAGLARSFGFGAAGDSAKYSAFAAVTDFVFIKGVRDTFNFYYTISWGRS